MEGLDIGVSVLPRVQYTDNSDFIWPNSVIETVIPEAEAPNCVSQFFGKLGLLASHFWVRGATERGHFQPGKILISGFYASLRDVKPQIVEVGLSKCGPTERRH